MALVSQTTPQAMVTLIADEFERRGWRAWGDLPVAIVRRLQMTGRMDAAEAARCAPRAFLARNGIRRATLERVIANLLDGRELVMVNPDSGVTVHGDINFSVSGDHNTLSNINLGGQQFALSADTPKEDVLSAVERLVSEAIGNDWPVNELQALASHVDGRADIAEGEVETAATRAIEQAKPGTGRLADLRNSLLAGTVSGLLVHGISAALGI